MRIGFLVCEEVEVESCRKYDQRIAQGKMMALGLPCLKKDPWEAALVRMILVPVVIFCKNISITFFLKFVIDDGNGHCSSIFIIYKFFRALVIGVRVRVLKKTRIALKRALLILRKTLFFLLVESLEPGNVYDLKFVGFNLKFCILIIYINGFVRASPFRCKLLIFAKGSGV
jgi:hypothetical protein